MNNEQQAEYMIEVHTRAGIDRVIPFKGTRREARMKAREVGGKFATGIVKFVRYLKQEK